jgi:hypothetical protein
MSDRGVYYFLSALLSGCHTISIKPARPIDAGGPTPAYEGSNLDVDQIEIRCYRFRGLRATSSFSLINRGRYEGGHHWGTAAAQSHG